MRTLSVLVPSIAIAGAALAAGASLAAAATPTVVGKVGGKLPPSSRAATEIRAFEAGQARLVARAKVARNGTFRLALPPGGYVLATSITPERGRSRAAVRRLIPLTLAAGQRRRRVKIAKPTAKSSAAASPSGQVAYMQESGAINPGKIAFSVEHFTGATGELGVMNKGLAELLQVDLFRTPCRTSSVGNSSDRVLIARELEFEMSEYVDPATRVTRNFIDPDIVVHGRLKSRGGDLGYALTLVDRRTGAILETVAGTLDGRDLFAAEERLARRLAKRLCAYGEVFEVTFAGTGRATFATHSATATLSAQPITAKPIARDRQGAIRWEGSAPVSWSNVAVTSTTDCSYADPVSGGTWTAKLARAGERLDVQWLADAGAAGTATVVCPIDGGGEVRVPGQPTTALVGSTPVRFLLPPDGVQPVTGGFKDAGSGWDNTLELKVRTIRLERLSGA